MAMILLVEDDTTTRAFLRHYLVKMGHDVVEATDGIAALATMRTAKIDMVLTDLEMPHMNGLELIAVLRQNKATLPIIALSGHPDMLDKVTKAGGQLAITKPVRYATLEPAVRGLLK